MIVMGLGTPANAALQSIGPVDQATAFPTVVTDFNGVTLGQCLDPFHCAASPADLPFPDQPISFPDNIADEIFWYMLEMGYQFPSATPGALPGEQGSMLFISALEGAFAGGPVLVGDNIF